MQRTLSDTIQSLEEKVRSLREKVDPLRLELVRSEQALALANLDAQCEKYNIHIGDVVRRKGEMYRVTRLSKGYEKPWAYGVKKRKNGEWGTGEFYLYSEWEKEGAKP